MKNLGKIIIFYLLAILLIGFFYYLSLDNSASNPSSNNITETNTLKIEIVEKYYDNGNIKSKISMRNAEKHGESKYYFESGELKAIRSYSDGDRHGKFITFNKEGGIKRESIWEYNKKVR